MPASLDAQSLQINADAGVRVGEFNVRTQDRDVVTACASPLDGRICEMEDQIASVKADMESLQLVDSYLKTVAVAGAAEGANGRLQPLTPAQRGAHLVDGSTWACDPGPTTAPLDAGRRATGQAD
ncbi:hypothetical protein [Rhodoferax saidenbachensis]|uniref:Uncharacterized protein n=1 Tax=Rhodoferax saidenbachensis TaxID=1484693 RepID=A0ABU1ZNW9_9BURK|nr:hypothetical protein [Rhodoferax saidenbachensis]MDR7306241.1 hypothetical protein [Rhodoferax saidenbachensis]